LPSPLPTFPSSNQGNQYSYETADWVDDTHQPLPLNSERVRTSMYQFVPGEFFLHTLRSIFTLSACTTILTHANVQELLTDADGGRVVGAKIANLRGGEFVVQAGIFILAAGGLENARLLLLSNSKRPAGLGNTHDLVGRYFMDHPQSHGNLLFFSNAATMSRLDFYDMRVVKGDHVMGRLSLTEAAMRGEQLLGVTGMLVPRTPGDGSIAVKSLRALARQVLKYRRFPDHVGDHVRSVILGLPDLAQFAYHRATHTDHHYSIDRGGWSQEEHPEVFNAVELVMSVEQTPHRENRVVLNHEADRLGRLELELHNKWRSADQTHFERILNVFTQEFERSKIGHFVPNDHFMMTMSSHHPTGTTRMHVDPKLGVVDADTRLHAVPNLYVTGSSVFPTDSALNPTLTIIALAIRLADHLKAELRKVAEVSISQTA
jgi:choline dehydrogenase-like flavoprotein